METVEKSNPFQVLKLPADTTNKDIVARGQELTNTAETNEQRLLYRKAVEELITNPSTRLEYELFEIPGSRYEDPDWERFVRLHRRNPINLSALANEVPPPGLLDFDLEALIDLLLDGLLAVKEAEIRDAVENTPFKAGCGRPSLEVRDVIFG